jgi:hypothetical protein
MPKVNTIMAANAWRQRRIVWRKKAEPFLTGALSLIAAGFFPSDCGIQYRAPPAINASRARVCRDFSRRWVTGVTDAAAGLTTPGRPRPAAARQGAA